MVLLEMSMQIFRLIGGPKHFQNEYHRHGGQNGKIKDLFNHTLN